MNKRLTGRIIQHLPVTIIFPVILCVILFILTIFEVTLPALESALMANRRNLLHNLTELALSTIDLYERRERSGVLTREQAQARAIEHIRQLRYGAELKDYFWINDMTPRIIMHPYRPDLDGQDVSGYVDPNGKRLFVEFVKVVDTSGAGYVDYEWQWKDDPSRIVPKISYVKGFRPWNWVVGTGIYVNDIRMEIHKVTKNLTIICLGILSILFLLSTFIVWQGVSFEKDRARAENQAKLQQEQLIQAAKMASVGTLVSGVAHEVNNPATSIMLNAPLLKKIWKGVSPIIDSYCTTHDDFQISGMDYHVLKTRVPRLLDHIEEGVARIKSIVMELKDFARSTPPEMMDDVNINQSVKKAIGLVTNMISKSTDHFSVDYRMDLPTFRGNAQKIEQVIINLLVNSCQALQKTKDIIEIRTGYEEATQSIMVRVKDTGVGIPFEVLDRIKDPFFTTKQNSGNTGLGLAISDRIVKDHGGNMFFTSVPGEGTCVRISFPVSEAAVSQGDG